MSESKTENEHLLTGAEKRLRDWLMQHPEGGEMWCIVKGGFRRSYRDALADVAADLTAAAERAPDHDDYYRGRKAGLLCAAARILVVLPTAGGGSDG